MNWRDEYKKKLMSFEQAAKLIKSGDRVHIPVSDTPDEIITAIIARKDELRGVHIDLSAPGSPYLFFYPGYEESFLVTIVNFTLLARDGVRERRLDYMPFAIGNMRKLFDYEERPMDIKPVDVLLIKVRPPNERGFCNLGPVLWYKKTCAKFARKIIAEIDSTMSFVFGDTFMHVSEIDAFVEHDSPMMWDEEVEPFLDRMESERKEKISKFIWELGPRMRGRIVPMLEIVPMTFLDLAPKWLGLEAPTEAEKSIAGYLSTLIKDGDCIQLGAGTPTAYMPGLGVFDNRLDLGLHSEISGRMVATLIDQGVITGKHKTIRPGKSVTCSWEGASEKELMNIIESNPNCESYDPHIVFRQFAEQENMTAINSILSIDLLGQITAEYVPGPTIVYGAGGQPECHIGALHAKGGKAISLLSSTSLGGTISNIVPMFDAGIAVTIPRYWADYVITEYGIARLHGKSNRERAGELIAIAHPDCRAELKKEAQRLFYP
ncbi:MAG: acetyl-CoA hydrolase/transferase C-terminal domain-containing protein [Thermodesulfobacteriota bacterium]|nr:acetyl-CoA hydrolase/transferase C-terminal domain-containing protein [Thermodesulfobacteriota bacterium]